MVKARKTTKWLEPAQYGRPREGPPRSPAPPLPTWLESGSAPPGLTQGVEMRTLPVNWLLILGRLKRHRGEPGHTLYGRADTVFHSD